MRNIFLLLAATALLLTSPTLAADPETEHEVLPASFVSLKSDIVIQEGVIRLGDFFEGVGQYGERIVAYAPRPGGRAVYDARWLLRVAKAFKLDWHPASKLERLVVKRDAYVVTKSEIADLLHDRLIAEGGDPSSRVMLSNRDLRLHLPVGDEYALGVEAVSFDPAKGRFSAVLAWGSGKDERRRVTGLFERMTEIPVLGTRKMNGDVIRETDLQWIETPERRLSENTIIDPARIVGMAAKRSIPANRPVSQNDLQSPRVVAKGEIVTMVLSTPIMRLTAKGKAMQHGSIGDTIRISNTQTNVVIDGVITGPGKVRVDAHVNLAMR